MRTVDIFAKVTVTENGDESLCATKIFPSLDVMKTNVVRQWTTKTFNKILKTASKDQIVRAAYTGQLKNPPYTFYSGGLTGVNGRIVRCDGEYDV